MKIYNAKAALTRFASQQKLSYLNLINITSQKNIILVEYQKNDSRNNSNVSKIVFNVSISTYL